MITPVFSITQDPSFVIITIRAPYAKISETEIEYGDDIFAFSSAPYYLRIHLPGAVVDDNTGDATYSSENGEFLIRVPKQEKGAVFPNLDMISELLRPQCLPPSAKALVEEMENDDDSLEDAELDNEGNEYVMPQNVQDISAGIRDEESCMFGYGFGWRRTGVLEQLRTEVGCVVDLLEPEIIAVADRSFSCLEFDANNFDAERYLLDSLDPLDELKQVISLSFQASLTISEQDRERLKDLPHRKLPLLSLSDERATALSLIDIVFAWLYDQRISDWEGNSESGWNIAKLSPSLSYLVRWTDSREAVIGSVRRVLCYPLYRSWDLSLQVLKDAINVFENGRSAILHILCRVHSEMVNASEFRYLLNDLIITDLLLWIQSSSRVEQYVDEISKELKELLICKSDIGLDLDTLDVEYRIAELNVNEPDSDDES